MERSGQRFFDLVNAFRQQFDFAPQKPLTFVIDLGIYGMDVFDKIIEWQAEDYFVTWEKGYQGGRFTGHRIVPICVAKIQRNGRPLQKILA